MTNKTLRSWAFGLAFLGACASPPPPAEAPAPPAAPAAPAPDANTHEHHHPDKPLVHTFDDDPAVWAKRFDRPERAAKQKPTEVVAAMKITAGMSVADIGTGTGYFLPYLSPAVGDGGHVHALDIEPKMIDYVKKRAEREGLHNVEASVVKVDDPMLKDGSLDRILLVNTWHHIPEREIYSAKLARGLKPGGQVWIVDYKKEAEDGPPKPHRIEPAQVEKELSAGGLSTRVDTELLPDQYIVIGTKK